MAKETAEVITECWQLLIDYIPRRDQSSAAEQLFTYLNSVLSKEELEAIADLDDDLNEIYQSNKIEEDYDDEEEDEEEEYDYDED